MSSPLVPSSLAPHERDSEKHRPMLSTASPETSDREHLPHHGGSPWGHTTPTSNHHHKDLYMPHSPVSMSNVDPSSSSTSTTASSSFSSTCSFLAPSSFSTQQAACTTDLNSEKQPALLDSMVYQEQHPHYHHHQQQQKHPQKYEDHTSALGFATKIVRESTNSQSPFDAHVVSGSTFSEAATTSTPSSPSTPQAFSRPPPPPPPLQQQQRPLSQSQPMDRQLSSSSFTSSCTAATSSPFAQTPIDTTEFEASDTLLSSPSYFGRPWATAISSSASSSSSSSLASSYAKVGIFWGNQPTLEDTRAAAQSTSSSLSPPAAMVADQSHCHLHSHEHPTLSMTALSSSYTPDMPYHRCLWPPESTMITSSTPSTFKSLVANTNSSLQPTKGSDYTRRSPPLSPNPVPSSPWPTSTRSRISQTAAERLQPKYLYPNIDSQILFLPRSEGQDSSSNRSNCSTDNIDDENGRDTIDEHINNPDTTGMSTLGGGYSSSSHPLAGSSGSGSRSEAAWQVRQQRNIHEASQPQYLQQLLRALELQEVKIRQRRRQQDEPTYRERNNSYVRRLIQEAVEHGIGEIDLSNRELDDLPSDIVDLNCAIIYNERGSLLCNKLQLYLSSNLFTSVPKAIFSLKNLSVLSLRNNHLTELPPEIGLLENLVELSIGGNQLKYLPWQITQLSKLVILNVHPNPFLIAPEQPPPEPQLDLDAQPVTFAMPNQEEEAGAALHHHVPDQEEVVEPLSPPLTPSMALSPDPIHETEQEESQDAVMPTQGHLVTAESSSSSSSSSGTTTSTDLDQHPVVVPVEELFAIGTEQSGSTAEEDREDEDEDGDAEHDHLTPLMARVAKERFPSLKVIAGTVLLRSMTTMVKTRDTSGRKMTKDKNKTDVSTAIMSSTPLQQPGQQDHELAEDATRVHQQFQRQLSSRDKDCHYHCLSDTETESDTGGGRNSSNGSNRVGGGGGPRPETHDLRSRKKRTHSVSWDIEHLGPQASRPKAEEEEQQQELERAVCDKSTLQSYSCDTFVADSSYSISNASIGSSANGESISSPSCLSSPVRSGGNNDDTRWLSPSTKQTLATPIARAPPPPDLSSPSKTSCGCDNSLSSVKRPCSFSSSSEEETAMICQRTKMQAALTPYLFEALEHAMTTRLTCPGCGLRIWKSCRRIVVWQEVVGQAVQVPVEYRGCGLGACLGLPPRMKKRVRMCA